MALNLRTITPELHAELKIAAANAHKPLERFCLDALEGLILRRIIGIAPVAEPVVDLTKPKMEGHHPRCQCSLCRPSK